MEACVSPGALPRGPVPPSPRQRVSPRTPPSRNLSGKRWVWRFGEPGMWEVRRKKGGQCSGNSTDKSEGPHLSCPRLDFNPTVYEGVELNLLYHSFSSSHEHKQVPKTASGAAAFSCAMALCSCPPLAGLAPEVRVQTRGNGVCVWRGAGGSQVQKTK